MEDAAVIDIKGYKVLLSACDVERVMSHKWYRIGNTRNNHYYFAYKSNYKDIRLHRFIVNCPEGMQVDHINNNTLDNRRSNLRVCTIPENSRNCKKYRNNTSGFKGVSWNVRIKKWQAYISIGGSKNKNLGCYNTPEEAYKAYCEASKKYHGEFGRVS